MAGFFRGGGATPALLCCVMEMGIDASRFRSTIRLSTTRRHEMDGHLAALCREQGKAAQGQFPAAGEPIGENVGHPPYCRLQFAEIPAASQVRYDGDPFSYMAAGRTEAWPLVLLHGVGANSMHWRFQFAAFAERFRVIAWNAPGYILSDNFLAETPDWLDYAHAPEGRGHGMTLPPFFPPDDRLAVAC